MNFEIPVTQLLLDSVLSMPSPMLSPTPLYLEENPRHHIMKYHTFLG